MKPEPSDVRIVFMGSPAFAVPSLRALVGAGYNVVAAVSQPDRPAGRGAKVHLPEVKQAALELGIESFQPETFKDPAARDALAAFDANLFVVAAYGKILPRGVLALPRHGCLNVHGSLLPRWRGPSPIAAAILAGDAETGISIMQLEPRMDAGPVLLRRAIPIGPSDTTAALEPRLSALGAELLLEALPGWLDGSLAAEPQDESLASYCSLLTRDDGALTAAMSIDAADRAVRAYNPYPAAFVQYNGARLAIWAAHPVEHDTGQEPGTLEVVDKRPAINFRGGHLILDEVQRPGGRRLTGDQFVNGERGRLAPSVGLT
jgi:methionyl-tRNA formyltransferase